MEAMNEIFCRRIYYYSGSIITIIVFIATMFYINVHLTLAVLVVLPFLVVSVWIFKNAVQKSFTASA
jgi:ABC-type multidrug transport system fused ATPase/permease subunit